MSGELERRADQAPVAQDLPFQRRQWSIQRWGWVLMTILVVATLAGLFGAGPLANAEAETANTSLRLQYHRFTRVQSPTRLDIELATNGQDEAALWFDRAYLDRIQIEAIDPEPVEVRGGDQQVFVFAVAPDEAVVRIRIDYRHEESGRATGTAGIPGGQDITFDQLVYP